MANQNSKEKTCSRCGNTFSYYPQIINGLVHCWNCSQLVHKEHIETAYPTQDQKLIGVIEHLEKLNTNLDKQQQQLISINHNIGRIKTILIGSIILGVIIGVISAIS